MWKQFPYEESGMTIANFAGELNIPSLFGQWLHSFHIAKSYCDQYEILHKCQEKTSPDHMAMYTCNSDIKVHFWIVISLMM